jgi:hypothetical protein
MLRNASRFSFALGACLLLAAGPARADDDKGSTDKKDDAKKDDSKKDDAKANASEDALDPFEDPLKRYYFIGLRFREAIVPKFMFNWFADGGRNVFVPMVGPEFITRRDHLEVAIALMWADYGMDPFLFKGHSDPDTSYELAQSTMKLGYAMFDFMYEFPIEKKGEKTGRVAFLIGGGFGIAFVAGSLYRSQAYPNMVGADPGNPAQWSACHGPNDGMVGAGANYCNNPTNNHYWPGWSKGNPLAVGAGAYSEPSWTGGGSKWPIFPWLSLPQFAIRYKPIKQFQAKFDLGFSTSGFWLGLSASYGIPTN